MFQTYMAKLDYDSILNAKQRSDDDRILRKCLGCYAVEEFFESAGIDFAENAVYLSTISLKTRNPVSIGIIATDDPTRDRAFLPASQLAANHDLFIVATIYTPRLVVLNGWLTAKDFANAAKYKNDVLVVVKEKYRPISQLLSLLKSVDVPPNASKNTDACPVCTQPIEIPPKVAETVESLPPDADPTDYSDVPWGL